MIANAQITLDGIQYQVVDGEGKKPTGETIPLKILLIKDLHSNLTVQLMFTPEQFDAFKDKLSENQIVRPRNLDPFFTRNGGIRG